MKQKIYIPIKEEEIIVNLYHKENKTIDDIKLLYNCSHTPILRILNKYGVPRKTQLHYRRKINESQEKIMCEEYNNGINTPELAKKYNISTYTVNRFLRLNNINIRLQKDSRRTHKFKDEHFFDKIDTEAKAYFLGLLWTDGCNYIKIKDNNHVYHVVISLQEQDKHILDTFCKYIFYEDILQYRKTKKDYNRQDQYSLRIVSEHVSKTLLQYGMTPRKSFTLKLPKCIPDTLMNHFVRGLWDGDGSIYFNTTSKNYACNFIGSIVSCKQLNKILLQKVGISFSFGIRNNYTIPMGTLTIHSTNKSKTFLNWLYNNSNPTLRLNRKFMKYQMLLKQKDVVV